MATLFGFPSVALEPNRLDFSIKSGSETSPSTRSSLTYVPDLEKPKVDLERPSLSGASPRVSTLARRIHGWSWQAVCLIRPGVHQGAIEISLLLIVPYRHGDWCCLCHPGGLERAPWISHERRDFFVLHKPLALYPQLIDTTSPSDM